MLVTYTKTDGFKQIREVPKSVVHESEYGRGILVGPPDLSGLGLSLDKTKRLNNLLVDRGLATFSAVQRDRDSLMEVVRAVFGTKDKQKMVDILIIYQDYFNGENNG